MQLDRKRRESPCYPNGFSLERTKNGVHWTVTGDTLLVNFKTDHKKTIVYSIVLRVG